jgi:hypothetical protein
VLYHYDFFGEHIFQTLFVHDLIYFKKLKNCATFLSRVWCVRFSGGYAINHGDIFLYISLY